MFIFMKKIIISSSFGHEVMAVAIAKSMNLSVVVVPNKDNAEDFHKESENIYLNCRSILSWKPFLLKKRKRFWQKTGT